MKTQPYKNLRDARKEKSEINNLTYHLKELKKKGKNKSKIIRRNEMIKIRKEINDT